MAIEYLTKSGTATIEAGDLAVEIAVHGGGPVRLQMTDAHGVEAQVLRLSSTRLVATGLQSSLFVVAEPVAAEFPPGTIVELSFTTTVAGRTSQVFGQRTDISALDRVRLAEVAPRDDQVTVIRALQADDVEIDPNLTELAGAALRSARRLQSKGVIPRSRDGLALGIDSSASMLVHRGSGLLQTLVEVALGVDRGMGDGGDVPAFAVGRTAAPVAAIASANAANYIADTAGEFPPTTGFRPSVLAGTAGLDDHDRTILVVTDAVPADYEECAAQWAAHPCARWRLVLIGPAPRSEDGAMPPGIAVIDPGLTTDDLLTGAGAHGRLQRLVVDLIGRADARGGS